MPATAGCPPSEPGRAEQPRPHGDGLICRSKTSSVASWSAFGSWAFEFGVLPPLSIFKLQEGDGAGFGGGGLGHPPGRRAQPAAR